MVETGAEFKMNKRNSIILALLFLIVIVQLIVLAPKQTGPPEPEIAEDPNATPTPPKVDMGGQVMGVFHLVGTKESRQEWELWASEAARPNEVERWTIKDVKVRFFATNGVLYDVTGKTGLVDPQKNQMRIEGDVVTHSSNGYVFRTDLAIYDSGVRYLKSPHKIKMDGPSDFTKQGVINSGLVLTGEDMTADMASNEIKINKNVHAKKGVQGNKIATIQSQRAEFSGRTNLAHFVGDVVLDFETMRVTGPEARFAFHPKSGSLESVEVEGGVKVTDMDKFATSKKVSVQFVEDQIVFSGSPRVVQNGDEVVGDEIVFSNGGKKVRVSNMRGQIEPESIQNERTSGGQGMRSSFGPDVGPGRRASPSASRSSTSVPQASGGAGEK